MTALVVSQAGLLAASPLDRRGSSEPAEGSREWRSRWLVRGHWHNYWEGSGTARVLVPHWLAPYVKGPEGLPVSHAERVFEVSR